MKSIQLFVRLLNIKLLLGGLVGFLIGYNALAQAPNFGDDSSQWSQDGECDDPRFQGTGMASTLIDADRFSDATDCRLLFNQELITLRDGDTSPGANPIETSSGTGFFVSRDGHILTNQHVIDGCQEVQIHTNGNRYMVSVIAADRVNDLALLKSELIPSAIFPINRETPILLQDIYVAGYPFGDDISTSVQGYCWHSKFFERHRR